MPGADWRCLAQMLIGSASEAAPFEGAGIRVCASQNASSHKQCLSTHAAILGASLLSIPDDVVAARAADICFLLFKGE